jgi:O-antigen/teichoic acid export membrane protein
MLVYPAMSIFQAENMFKYKYKVSTLISLLSVIILIGAALMLTYFNRDNRLEGRIYGYFITLIAFNIIIYFYLIIRGKAVSLKYLKYALVISVPMIWHTLSLRLLTAGDRVVIIRTVGEEANAMYSVAYTCCHVVSVLYGAMNNAWSPWATERMNSGETEEMKKASRFYVCFYSVIVLFVMLVCPELLLIMGGREYLDAKYVMPPVMVACICQFIYSLYINAEFYLKKQTRIAIGTILAAIINVILNIIFVPIFGYNAAAYTTLVGYLCLFIFHYLSLRNLKKGHWYDNRFNIGIIVGFIVLMGIIIVLYHYTIVRYIVTFMLLVVTLFFMFKYRSYIIKLLKLLLKK